MKEFVSMASLIIKNVSKWEDRNVANFNGLSTKIDNKISDLDETIIEYDNRLSINENQIKNLKNSVDENRKSLSTLQRKDIDPPPLKRVKTSHDSTNPTGPTFSSIVTKNTIMEHRTALPEVITKSSDPTPTNMAAPVLQVVEVQVPMKGPTGQVTLQPVHLTVQVDVRAPTTIPVTTSFVSLQTLSSDVAVPVMATPAMPKSKEKKFSFILRFQKNKKIGLW